MVENKRLLQKLACATRNRRLGRRFAEEIPPDLVAGVRDHKAADHSAHAVTDENDRLSIRESARDAIQLTAKQRRRIRIRIAARITKNPKLVAALNLRVFAKRVDHWHKT